jgi:hypothetical protein
MRGNGVKSQDRALKVIPVHLIIIGGGHEDPAPRLDHPFGKAGMEARYVSTRGRSSIGRY